MYELHTGRPLLPATSDIFFLFAMMEGTIGNFDKVFADRYKRNNQTLFHDELPRRVNFPLEADPNPECVVMVKKARYFAVYSKQLYCLGNSTDRPIQIHVRHPDLANLLSRTLKLNPTKHASPVTCQQHKYFGVATHQQGYGDREASK